MLKKQIIMAMASCVLSAPLLADGNFYAGGNVSALEQAIGGGIDLSFGVVSARGGYNFSDYFSTELRLGVGVADDSYRSVDVKLEQLAGIFVRGTIPVGGVFKPYVALGYSHISIEVSAYRSSDNESDSDVSYGIGADFDMSDSLVLNLEYTTYYDDQGSDISGATIGVAVKF